MSYQWATVIEKIEWVIKRVESRHEISKKPETKQELEDLNEILGTAKRMAPDDLKSTEEYIEQLSQNVGEFNEELKTLGEEFPELKAKQKHAV